nr:YegP family protein [uncultured Campylobacter sp.]
MAEFLIKDAKDGCKFDLLYDGHVLCTSEVYTSKAACKNGIESVVKNAALNKIEDQISGGEKLNNPKFELYTDKAGKVRFRLTASNGQIIAVSKDFEAKADALKVIELIVKQAPKAKIKEA